MGVSGLNRYITKFEKTIMQRIQIREEIENWKLNHDGQPPQILIDLKECVQNFVQKDEIGLILGGRFDYYNKMLRQFLENLHKTGAKLVFFFPGKKTTDDLQFFIPKSEETYLLATKTLDKIYENCELKELKDYLDEKNKPANNIRMVLAFNHNLKKMVRRYGEFRVNYIKHNAEIAQYANEHSDVLAVISNDTDFMAFEGDFEYWSANSINFKQMSATKFCKKRLHEKLGFDFGPYQVQLLSAFCGSRFLPLYVLTDFIEMLKETSEEPTKRGKILKVAEYVKRQKFDLVKNKPKYDLEKISRDVFGGDFTDEQLNSIANGLACYELNFKEEIGPNDRIKRDAFVKFCKSHDSFMYNLAIDDIFIVKDITYIDYRVYRTKNYAELVIPIVKKICGILNKDYPRRPTVRRICMKHAHDEPCKVTEENIIYPPMDLPERFDLIFKNKERTFDKFRWPLLEWILDLDDGFVKKLHDQKSLQPFAAVIITLQYLLQQGELTVKEASAILFTEHKVRNLSMGPVDLPNFPNGHFIRIAHLYVKMYVFISHCMDVCGLHEMTDLIRFEGALFHKTMEKFENVTEEQLRTFESSADSLWAFS